MPSKIMRSSTINWNAGSFAGTQELKMRFAVLELVDGRGWIGGTTAFLIDDLVQNINCGQLIEKDTQESIFQHFSIRLQAADRAAQMKVRKKSIA